MPASRDDDSAPHRAPPSGSRDAGPAPLGSVLARMRDSARRSAVQRDRQPGLPFPALPGAPDPAGREPGDSGDAPVPRRLAPGRLAPTPRQVAAAQAGAAWRERPPAPDKPRWSHPKQMLEPFRHCGQRLPFRRAALATLAVLVDLVPVTAWLPGQRPIVFARNIEIAARVGVTRRTVQLHLQWLRAAGIITDRTVPGGRRACRTRQDGGDDRYGIDLSPLPAAAEAIAALQTALHQRRLRLRDVWRDCQEAIEQCLIHADAVYMILADATAPAPAAHIEASLGLADIAEQARTAEQALARMIEIDAAGDEAVHARHDVEAPALSLRLRALAGEARRLAAAVLLAEPASESEMMPDGPAADAAPAAASSSDGYDSPRGESGFVVIPTTPKPSSSPPTADAPGIGSAGDVPAPGSAPAPGIGAGTPDLRIRIRDVLAASPPMAETLRSFLEIAPDQARARDLVEAARILLRLMGGSELLWRDGCRDHGVETTTLAVALAAGRPADAIREWHRRDGGPRPNRAAFLAGILRKAPDAVNVTIALHAQRRRLQSSAPGPL